MYNPTNNLIFFVIHISYRATCSQDRHTLNSPHCSLVWLISGKSWIILLRWFIRIKSIGVEVLGCTFWHSQRLDFRLLQGHVSLQKIVHRHSHARLFLSYEFQSTISLPTGASTCLCKGIPWLGVRTFYCEWSPHARDLVRGTLTSIYGKVNLTLRSWCQAENAQLGVNKQARWPHWLW